MQSFTFQNRRVLQRTALLALFAALGSGLAATACSSDSKVAPPGTDGGAKGTGGSGADGGSCQGGPVSGDADTHCGSTKQATGACTPESAADAAAAAADAGADDYGDTLYNTEGDDDDCKYHVKYTVTPVCDAGGATFTVTTTSKVDGSPVTGADAYIEAFLDETHIAPPSNPKTTEKADGVYEIGPIKFDAPGRWTVRFHFFGDCADAEDSPHGHAAFFVDIP